MVITSLGIFGFLSKAHLEHSVATGGTNELQIENLERQIDRQRAIITDSETVLTQLDDQVATLIEYDRIRGPSGSIATRQGQAEERQALNETIDDAYTRIETLQTQLTPLQQEKLAIEVEVGPLKYIAELIYGDAAEDYFDEAVRAVIILLIVTFDPLAVVLLLAATSGFQQRRQEKLMVFNPDNVSDIENNWEITKVDPDKYTFIEENESYFEEDPIPSDDDVEDYDVVKEDPDDGHGVDLEDPTEVVEPSRKSPKGKRRIRNRRPS